MPKGFQEGYKHTEETKRKIGFANNRLSILKKNRGEMTEKEFTKTIAETTNSTPTITYSVGKRMFTGKFKNSMDHNQVMFASSITELFEKMTSHLKKHRVKPENKWDNKVFKNNEKVYKLP